MTMVVHIDINMPYYRQNRASMATWTNFTDYSLAMFDERIRETVNRYQRSKVHQKSRTPKPSALTFRIAPYMKGCPDNGPKISDPYLPYLYLSSH